MLHNLLHKYKIAKKEYSMPRNEAVGGTERYPGDFPRTVEDFVAALRTKHGHVVQSSDFAIVWAADPFTGEQAPFYPVYGTPRIDRRGAPIERPTAKEIGRQPRVRVFLEPGGAQWCQYGDQLCKMENITAPEQAHSVIPKPNISLNPGLQKKLAQHERRRKRIYKVGASIATLVMAGIGAANSPRDTSSEAILPPAQSSTIVPTRTPTESPSLPRTPEPTPTPSAEETATPTPVPVETDQSITSSINVATANLLYSNEVNKVNSIFKTLFKTNQNHVVATQEGNPFKKTVFAKIACEYKQEDNCTKGIAMFPGAHSGDSGRNQIFWDTEKFSFVKGDSDLAARDLDTRGRGFKHKRYVNWVLLKDKVTGQDVYFINIHAPNSVEKNGLPSRRKPSVKAHKQYMKAIVKKVEKFQEEGKPIILMGDFNVDARDDNARCSYLYFPCRMLDPLMDNMWLVADLGGDMQKVGTHGDNNRLIDHVYHSETNLFKMTIAKAYLNTSEKNGEAKKTGGFKDSDHKPVNVQFTVTATHKKTGKTKEHSFTIALDGVQNFRDAGASSGGQAINKYVVYRSGKLENATKEDISKLSRLVTKVIDLRAPDIQAKAPDPVIPGVERKSFPITSSSNGEEYIDNFVLDLKGRKQFGRVLTEIANTDGAVLVHCTEGKDRTGWVAALLGIINGAKNTHIENDYTLSRSNNKYVNVSWLRKTFAAAKEKFGDSLLDGYIKKGLGVSDATIAKLRAKLDA